MFKRNEFLPLVSIDKILKGIPVADPFVVAAAKVHGSSVVTQEKYKKGGARIPSVCKEFNVKCINVERFLELEKIKL